LFLAQWEPVFAKSCWRLTKAFIDRDSYRKYSKAHARVRFSHTSQDGTCEIGSVDGARTPHKRPRMPSLPIRVYRTHSEALDREEIVRDMDVEQVAVCFLSQEIPGQWIVIKPL
jgi:hypothetical protein